MKKKRVGFLIVCVVAYIFMLGIAMASSKDFELEHGDVDATFYGRVDYTDYAIFDDTITYYAHISGSDAYLITDDDAATLKIYRYKNATEKVIVVDKKIYYGHVINTTQYNCETHERIYVEYSFDGITKIFYLYE